MAGSRGIDSKFFASAPTQVMDPNAGIPDPRVQQQLTDTVMQTDRDALAARQFDTNLAFRNREFDERSEQADRDDARSDQYLGLQKDQFKRSQGNQDFERAQQRRAAIADATRRWRAAHDHQDVVGMKQALEEIKSLGGSAKEYGALVAGAPAAAPGQSAPVAPPHAPHPMNAKDAAISKQLSQAEATIIPQLQGRASTPSPARPGNARDQALSAQLSGIEADMIPKLRGQAPPGSLNDQVAIDGEPVWPVSFFPPAPDLPQPGRGFLPGQRPIRPQVAQSNAMLSPGDPLNNIK